MTNRMNIRRRFSILLLSAGLLSFLLLGAVSVWGLYDAQQQALKNGMHMGAAAGASMEQITVNLAQQELSVLVEGKAHMVDRELHSLKSETEYIALLMERILSEPEGRSHRILPEAGTKPIASKEVYLHYAPDIRSPEARAALADEIGLASSIADSLEQETEYFESYGYAAIVSVASQKGYMISSDLLLNDQEYEEFTEEFLTTYDCRQRPWYKLGLAAGKAAATDIYYTAVEGFPAITFVAPYKEKNEIAGIACITLSLRSLHQVISDNDTSRSDINFVVNSKGVVVASSEQSGPLAVSEEKNDLRKSVDSSMVGKVESMVEGRSGVVPVSFEGELYYLAYEPIPSVGWSFGSMIRAQKVIAPAKAARASIVVQAEDFARNMGAFFRENLWEMALLLVVVLAAVAVAGQVAATRFVKPIMALTEGVREIAKGDLDKKLDIKTGDEIEELSDSVNHMTAELKEYITNIAKATADKQRISTELSLAKGIQEGMLPKVFPKTTENSGYELYATMEAAKSVGGDFYDFYTLDKDHIVVTMADVSGKGVPAALFMMISKTILKNNVLSASHLNDVETVDWGKGMELSNYHLCENNEEMMFVTVFFGVLNIKTGEFAYVNCGHNPPLIGRVSDGKVDWEYIREEKKSNMLGVIETASYEEKRLRLAPGDTLYLYTDGVTEAMDEEKTLYSEERLQETLSREGTAGRPVKDILAAVRADIDLHANGAEQSDDITMLGIRYLG